MRTGTQRVLVTVLWVALLSLVGCGDDDSTVTIGPPDSGAIKIPMDIHKAVTATGTLRGFISVFRGETEVLTQEMTIDGDEASATIPGLDPEVYSFTVEFEFEAVDFDGTFIVASATKELDVVAGSNNLDFNNSDYDINFHGDDDELNNLYELENNLNPSSNVCVVGFSLVGRCTLGG